MPNRRVVDRWNDVSGPKVRCARRAVAGLAACCVALIALLDADAAPANPTKVWTYAQPDGGVFKARAVGDENYMHHETADGAPIVQHDETGFWHYAAPAKDGRLAPSGAVVRPGAAPPDKLATRRAAWSRAVRKMQTKRAADRLRGGKRVEATGNVKGVMLLVNFTDTAPMFGQNDFDALMNAVGYDENGALGSVRDYYLEVSYRRFAIEFDVYGWFQLPHSRGYYGQNTGGAGTDIRPRQMIRDAVTAADGTVDFSQYDADGDGTVDVFAVVHQGQGEESGGGASAIISHRSRLSPAAGADGVEVRDYMTVPERQGPNTLATIGVYVHELGHHLFNLPDIYDLDFSSNGVGTWSVMGFGSFLGPGFNGAKPCHFDAWCKMALGWIDPTTITVDTADAPLPAADLNPSALFVPVDPYQDGEYFLVENRFKRSTTSAATGFDAYLPGSGALIWHIDDYVEDNRDEFLKKVDVEEADGNDHLDNLVNLGDAFDLFPLGAPRFETAGAPNTKDNGGANTGVVIDNFSGAGTDAMTCSVTVPSNLAGSALWYDAMGSSGDAIGFDGVDYGLVHFTADAAGKLDRVRTVFVFDGPMNYTVSVYSDFDGATPAGLRTTQSGTLVGPGVREIALDTPLDIAAGEDFYVEVRYDNGFMFPFVLPVENDADVAGRSYVSTNGVGYTALTKANGLAYDLNIRANLSGTLTSGGEDEGEAPAALSTFRAPFFRAMPRE